MAIVVVHQHERRATGGGCLLDGRDELARLPGNHARVVPAADAENGRVAHTGHDMLQTVHFKQRLGLRGILDGAELGGIDRAVG